MNNLFPEKFELIDIESVEVVEKGQTYDICVDEVHAFTTRSESGLESVSHNSATICLFSKEDKDMMNAKTGSWRLENPQRARSNNSVMIKRDEISKEEFLQIISSIKEYGEPGFVFCQDYNEGVNPCVSGDTIVKIREKDKEFEIRIDDLIYEMNLNPNRVIQILSFNTKTKSNEWKKLLNWGLTRKDANIIKLELSDGKIIKCTPDHKIFTNNRGYIEAKNLTLEDDICINKH